jgi:hypothetical protein
MKKVICINRTEKFKHHKKLVLGEIYFSQENPYGLSIYLNGESLGSFPREFFMDLREWKINQIMD